MKKAIQLFHSIILFSLLFSACEKTEIGMEEKMEYEMEEIATRAEANNGVYSIKGDMNPFVGTRQAYTVTLDRPASKQTRVAIRAGSDAILIAAGSTYARETTVTVPVYQSTFTFYALITKVQSKISLHVAAISGDVISNSRNLTYVSTQNPIITIDGPSKVQSGEVFEVSTNHTEVPNLLKSYEFSGTFFDGRKQFKSGSKIILPLRAPGTTGKYYINLKVYGGYNLKGYGGKFLIGQATLPIVVDPLLADLDQLRRINEGENRRPPLIPKDFPPVKYYYFEVLEK